MNALEYLKTLPAIVINVPSSTQKLQQFMSSTAPLFASTTIHPASPIVDARAEAYRWRDLVSASKRDDPLDMFGRVNVFQAQDKTLERWPKQHEYAATYSLYRSTIEAMLHGINMGWERFILLEDDAVPRYEVFDQIEAPPASGDLLIWGGAIGMGAHRYDDKLFLEGKNPKWKPINAPRGRYIATAYEVTARGALAHVTELTHRPHAVDCSWWYTMASVESHVLAPVGFVQWGQSDRINVNKSGAFKR